MIQSQISVRLTRQQWGVLCLLLVSVWINYIDRGNLSVAAPLLAPELNLTPVQMGLLLSSFFWTYAGLQFLGGWLVDRYSVSLVYGLGYLLWSFATLLTGIVDGFAMLLVFRLLLGAGESVAYPAYSKILAGSFAEHQRGLANALVDVGTKAGPAVGTLLGGLLMARFGWRVFFLGIGFLSLLWLLPWWTWAPRTSYLTISAQGPGMLRILGRREGWATFSGLFCFNYAFYFLLTWLPTYLVTERHFSMRMMAFFAALPFAVTAAASLLCGWLSDRWILAGATPSRVRKGLLVSGMILCALLLPVSAAAPHSVAMILLSVAFFGIGMVTSNIWAITQTLAGPTAAGQWTGLQNSIGNLGGVVAPIVTGWIVNQSGSFFLAFVAASVSLLLAAVVYGTWLGPVAPVLWEGNHKTAALVST
jgi:MFS transporter, ACS family, D-galactonate transporter